MTEREEVEQVEPKRKKKKVKRDYGVSPEDFVRAWQTSQSVAEVVEKLNKVSKHPMPEDVVSARAASYRKRRVNLKFMPKRMGKLDIEELNRLATEGYKEQG